MSRSGPELARLLSLISHEVRGPIGVVQGYLKLLDQTGASLSDSHRQAIAAALRAGDRAIDILRQLSALARWESGETVAVRTATPLRQLLESAVREVVLPAQPRVTLVLGATPPVTLHADESLLKQALALLGTAVVRAHTDDGAAPVSAWERERAETRGVAISLGDPPAGASTVEEPLDQSRGGLGLDLPLADWIIKAHDGVITQHRGRGRLVGVVVWLPIA